MAGCNIGQNVESSEREKVLHEEKKKEENKNVKMDPSRVEALYNLSSSNMILE